MNMPSSALKGTYFSRKQRKVNIGNFLGTAYLKCFSVFMLFLAGLRVTVGLSFLAYKPP
ncbi:hypothetical protein HYC85_020109 [Camellia sinensis]|uniref:Uncharacterized protein n=1 Tax=Camellia sinensis TaxID=4442 RepID=A0A7J7GPQ3_CAMSI|nr:hypothetical protein HYC85_020109 [Camellia sinensis]